MSPSTNLTQCIENGTILRVQHTVTRSSLHSSLIYTMDTDTPATTVDQLVRNHQGTHHGSAIGRSPETPRGPSYSPSPSFSQEIVALGASLALEVR